MRNPLLLVTALTCLAFAGCVGSGTGLTAMDATETMDGEAASWADDAVLLGVFGIEISGVNASVDLDMGPLAELQNHTDATPGDGYLSAWAAGYFSPSQGKILILTADGSGAHRQAEQDFPQGAAMPPSFLATAQDMRAKWDVDSPAAIEAMRAANTTLDAAFDGNVSMHYAFSPFLGLWMLEGQAGAWDFSAQVNYQSGEVVEITVTESKGLPTIGPGPIAPPPVPKGPPPAPIQESGSVVAAADPVNFIGLPNCSLPSAQCVEIPFTLDNEWDAEASLAWGESANDFDLYIYDDAGNVVMQAAGLANPEETSGTLKAGSYTIQVVPWTAAADSWEFEMTFS